MATIQLPVSSMGASALLKYTAAVPTRRTDTFPSASPHSVLSPFWDLNRRPLILKLLPQTHLLLFDLNQRHVFPTGLR